MHEQPRTSNTHSPIHTLTHSQRKSVKTEIAEIGKEKNFSTIYTTHNTPIYAYDYKTWSHSIVLFAIVHITSKYPSPGAPHRPHTIIFCCFCFFPCLCFFFLFNSFFGAPPPQKLVFVKSCSLSVCVCGFECVLLLLLYHCRRHCCCCCRYYYHH